MKKLILPHKKCPICGQDFGRESCKSVADYKLKKYCSRKCFYKSISGKNHWCWNNGIKTRPDGYMRDSKTDKYIHRIIMEQYIGRELERWEQVHHINGNPSDNRIENLILTKNGEHRKNYHKDSKRDKLGRYSK